MPLTPAQLVTFKADILASSDQVVVDALTAGSNRAISDWYSDTTPSFFVWRTELTKAEMYAVMDWSEVVKIEEKELLAFQIMMAENVVDPSQPSIRGGFGFIFRQTGTNSAPNTRAALIAIAKRLANRIEQLFATGTGSPADPATMTNEGAASLQDVRDALDLP